jgi:hypothetical protein
MPNSHLLSCRTPLSCHSERPSLVIPNSHLLSYRTPLSCHSERPFLVIPNAVRNLALSVPDTAITDLTPRFQDDRSFGKLRMTTFCLCLVMPNTPFLSRRTPLSCHSERPSLVMPNSHLLSYRTAISCHSEHPFLVIPNGPFLSFRTQ